MKTQADILELTDATLPRCFVLDEQDHIIMVCSAEAGRPTNPRFTNADDKLTFPTLFAQAVAVLAERCVLERKPALSARFGVYSLKVQLLRGAQRTRTAVIVDKAA